MKTSQKKSTRCERLGIEKLKNARGYCVYYPSVLKIGEYPQIFPSFSWGIFAHVTRFDQSRRERKYLIDYKVA